MMLELQQPLFHIIIRFSWLIHHLDVASREDPFCFFLPELVIESDDLSNIRRFGRVLEAEESSGVGPRVSQSHQREALVVGHERI